MSFKYLAFALPLLALAPLSQAQTVEKNGLPCVDEICLGDGIAELSKINWTPAQHPVKVNNKVVLTASRELNASDLLALKQTFPDPAQAGPFIYDRQFDATALPLLAAVTTACETNELIGNYVTATGNPTRVAISLTASPSAPTKQAWMVTTIVREYPTANGNEEKAIITKELKKRYYKYGASNQLIDSPKVGEGRFVASSMNRFGFALSMFRGTDEPARLKKFPACAGK